MFKAKIICYYFKSLHYTNILTIKTNTMKTTINLLAFLAAFLLSTGIMFKTFHWPYAGIILFSGFTVFNFLFLPFYFFGRKSNQKKTI